MAEPKDDKSKEVLSIKESRTIIAKVCEMYRVKLNPRRADRIKNLNYQQVDKLFSLLGDKFEEKWVEIRYTKKLVPHGVPLENWKKEALKELQPLFADVKLDDNVFNDKDKIATHITAWHKKLNPYSNTTFTPKSTKIAHIYDCLVSTHDGDTLPNFGKLKVMSLDHRVENLDISAVNKIIEVLKIA